jgi:hypothetical protein
MSQTDEKVEIIGANAFGETRKFTFQLMDAETGLEVFHSTVSGLVNMANDIAMLVPALRKVAEDYGDGNAQAAIETGNISGELLEVLHIVPEILTIEKVKYLAKNMLAGCHVVCDDFEETIPESGIGNYMARDPLELYAGIIFAVCANYPKYVQGLTSNLEAGQGSEDSTPPTTNQTVKMRGPKPR